MQKIASFLNFEFFLLEKAYCPKANFGQSLQYEYFLKILRETLDRRLELPTTLSQIQS
jgi:hypothetical protein